MPVEVKMPQLGESVTEGTISRWLKQPGEAIQQYEPLLEVTTDKVDTEIPSMVDGTVLELLVSEGETVRVGTLIARLAERGEMPERVQPDASTAASGSPPVDPPPISPVVARLAAEHGIDLSRIKGTGANSRVTKKDVEQYLASREMLAAAPVQPQKAPGTDDLTGGQPLFDVERAPEAAPTAQEALQETMESAPRSEAEVREAEAATDITTAPATATPSTPVPGPGDELVPLVGMRRAIAEHMARSRREIPHATTVMEVDLSRIAAHRERVKLDYERQGAHLTFTAYFVQVAVAALRAVPTANASYRDDGIVMHRRINIGIAVAIPDGLLVPVIKDADDKSLLGLARAVNNLTERARYRRLQPDDVRDGTFTITNHGVSGSLFAMPIINHPQAAILGIGAIEKRPVVVSDGGLDAIAIRLRAYVSLTFDHRVMDGAAADQFLRVAKATLEDYAG